MTMHTPPERDPALPEDRWQTIKTLWRNNHWLFAVVGFFAGLLAFPLIQTLDTDVGGFLQNLVPESIGIAFTVFIIDRLAARWAEKAKIEELARAERAKIDDLLRDVRSGVRDFAKRAISELQYQILLDGDKSLLNDHNLSLADLSEANLESASLKGAFLERANLSEAKLRSADLSFTALWDADLSGAILYDADLRSALMDSAKLEGAIFSAREENGHFYEAYMDEYTTLPDGTHYDPALGLEQLLRFGVILNYDPGRDEGEGEDGIK